MTDSDHEGTRAQPSFIRPEAWPSSGRSALIGHTGYVGGTLIHQRGFDDLYNSTNIEQIAGRHYELLVCSGASGTKWLANRDPERDSANIARLIDNLRSLTSDQVILISTVDVYGIPSQVDEDTPIDTASQTPYGRHRHQLEQMVRERFPRVLTVRLPGLFGRGLKKNALYDLLHAHEIEKIHSEAVYQFYLLDHLWRDIQRALSADLNLVNFATAPTSIQSVAREIFNITLVDHRDDVAPRYDVHTKHDAVFGGVHGYLYDRETVMNELRAFVAQERGSRV